MDSQSRWDSFYSSAEREQFLHLTDAQVDEILKQFPSAHSALDIGCGEGQLLVQLEKRNFNTIGIDVSPVALKEAHRYVTKGKLIEGDFESMSFQADQTFDLVFLKFVIAFIKNKVNLFRKIDSLLNEKGGLILLTPVISGTKTTEIIEDTFVEQKVLDEFLPRYFKLSKETVLYSEDNKRLSLYVCKK